MKIVIQTEQSAEQSRIENFIHLALPNFEIITDIALADMVLKCQHNIVILRLNCLDLTYKDFCLDFSDKKYATQMAKKFHDDYMLLKAVKIKNKPQAHIIDCTAGLGRDSFLLSAAGYQVTCIEKSPILFLMLDSALAKLKETSSDFERWQLLFGDADTHLKNLPRPDIIYIDPMFATKNKAQVKKENQILRLIACKNEDYNALFTVALEKAFYKVIIKRHIKADFIANMKPTFSITGKTIRFDVYAT